MDGIAWASSAMVAARTRLEIATGNLANVSTDGFRRNLARGTLTGSGVTIEQTESSDRGALRHTGRAFDLAIVGAGSFRVRGRDGAVSETRNGNFARDNRGILCDQNGAALLGVRGPVAVPDGATIDETGRIMLAGRQLNRISIAAGATIRSGFIECANVDAIGEMVNVLAAQRSYESAEKVVAAIDGAREKTATDVARVK